MIRYRKNGVIRLFYCGENHLTGVKKNYVFSC